jgi:hypothetical protein
VKVEVDATMFAEGPSPASSFFGHFVGDLPEDTIRSGEARIRFSDGSPEDLRRAAGQKDKPP